jgi:hypothetical protein
MFALGLFGFGADALRMHDDVPLALDGSTESSLKNGRWVTVEGMVAPMSLGQFAGRVFGTMTWGLQIEGHSVIIVTHEAFTPWLKNQGSMAGRWMRPFADALKTAEARERARDAGVESTGRDDSPRPEVAPLLDALRKPQRFTGVIFRPGSSGEVEYFDTKLQIGSFCSNEGVHCSTPPIVLLDQEEPRSRMTSIASALGCALGAILMYVLGMRARRRATG